MLRKFYNWLFFRRPKAPAQPFRPLAPLRLRYELTQTDFFQFEFLQSYWESRYIRKTARRNFFIWLVIGVVLVGGLLLSGVERWVLWAALLPLAYMGVAAYNYFWGYQNDYKQMQKLLMRAVDKDLEVFPKADMIVEFGELDVAVSDTSAAANRMFYYNDIEFVEQTDRLYVIGLYDDPGATHLFEFRKLLIAKRDLSKEQTKQLEALLKGIEAHYGLKPILEDHPFK